MNVRLQEINLPSFHEWLNEHCAGWAYNVPEEDDETFGFPLDEPDFLVQFWESLMLNKRLNPNPQEIEYYVRNEEQALLAKLTWGYMRVDSLGTSA